MLTASQIRKSFIDFFVEKNHTFVPSWPVVPIGDDTLLFTNAGMNQFKDVFLGTGSRKYKRAVNSQKCIRAGGKHNDLEDVGADNYHHTFFEMLGNWSFGDYFKAEAIEWAWELITKIWKIDPLRLHATYFGGDKHDNLPTDNEARDFWRRFLPDERIHSGNKKDNFWEMGDTGPCGPCSEIHYDCTPDKSGAKLVNTGSPEVIEIWNLVFIQFNRDSAGKLTPLPAKHVDTGMGLERVARILQGKNSNYDTDLFMPVIGAIAKIAGKKYAGTLEGKTDIAFRVVADHLRTLVLAITDGGMPSNEGRGYVLRRILRRAARFGRQFGMHEPFIYKLVDIVVDEMSDAFEEIKHRADIVKTVIKSEEESFGRTLDRGIEIFETAAKKAKTTGIISGADAFELYDTYGFPLDLTQLMAREQNLKVDTTGFDNLMEQQKRRARAAQAVQKGLSVLSKLDGSLGTSWLSKTEDIHKYDTDCCESKIVGFVDNEGFRAKGVIKAEMEGGIILDKTCFYAESGGQVGDCGVIETPNAKFIVDKTAGLGDCIIHGGKMAEGSLTVDDKVKVVVDTSRRETKKNHTATHLLQWALQQTLGRHVAQQGSLVSPQYLRFDFTSPRAMGFEEIKKVEELVNEQISAAMPVTSVTLPINEARKLDATALFGEKYGDTVRVIAVGAVDENHLHEAFSKEFCGGTHVSNTAVIGGFKIVKEESIAAGVRRITALTGKGLTEYYEKVSVILDNLTQTLKVPADQLCVRINKIIEDNKNLTKQLKTAAKQSGADIMTKAKQLLENCEKIGDSSIVASVIDSAPVDEVRSAIDMLKKKAGSAAVVFGFAEGDKVILLAGVTDDLIKKGLKAGDIIKEIAPLVGGAGGGRPQMAQAGGKNPSSLPAAIDKAAAIIREKLKTL